GPQQRFVALAEMPEFARNLRLLLRLGKHRLEVDHRRIAALLEIAIDIEHVRESARHAGGEVAPGQAEHGHRAAGHVLAGVIAHALDYRARTGIPHAEPLSGDVAEIRFARNRAVQHDVARDDVLGRLAAELRRRLHEDAAAGKALAA